MSVIGKLNEKMKLMVVDSKNEVEYEFFENLKKEDTSFSIVFDKAGTDGTLSALYKNASIVLENTRKEKREVFARRASKLLGRTMKVRVKKIDNELGIVYVRPADSTPTLTNIEIMETLKAMLAEKSQESVYGKVTMVTESFAKVNLYQRGIDAIITRKHWAPQYTDNMKDCVEKGDVLEFKLESEGYFTIYDETKYYFFLSRIGIADDAWKKLDPNNFIVGTTCIVTCKEMPERKSYWWGTSPHAKGIDVQCNYNPQVQIAVGKSFNCKVKECNPEEHILKFTPFEPSNNGGLQVNV